MTRRALLALGLGASISPHLRTRVSASTQEAAPVASSSVYTVRREEVSHTLGVSTFELRDVTPGPAKGAAFLVFGDHDVPFIKVLLAKLASTETVQLTAR